MRQHKHNFEGNLVLIGMHERINVFWHLAGYYHATIGVEKGAVVASEVGCFSSTFLLSRDGSEQAAEVSPPLPSCSLLAVRVEGQGLI